MKLAILLVLAIVAFDSSCGILVFGECPTITVQNDFDPEAYLGTWYEIKRYDKIFQFETDCVTSQYFDDGNNGYIVFQRMVDLLDRSEYNITATAILSYPDETPLRASLNISYIDQHDDANYFILATDYGNYSIVYNCDDYGMGYSYHYAWVLARMPNLFDEIVILIDDVLARFNFIDITRMRFTNQNTAECLGGGIEPAH